MAFTKVLPAGISSTFNLTVDSINSVGVITATGIFAGSGTFSGNVSVAGTLTYEDVTNVDSVGLITARGGVHVGAGISVVGVSTIGNTVVGGATTELVVTGDAQVTGTLTVGQNSTTINGAHEYPSIRPTLDLNFAATKTLDRRITFTRDSLGTYTDELGIVRTVSNNTPRFDHDPTTGESLGLLIEESRTNLFEYSEDFTNVDWGEIDVSLSTNSIIAPDGSTNSYTITEGTSNSQHNITDTTTVTGTKTFSVYAKLASGSRLFRIVDFNATDGAVTGIFNLSNGTIDTGISSAITDVGNGWYRCSITTTTTVESNYYISLCQSDGTFNYTGDGSSSFYIFGAQLEEGAFPTSYIPTSGSTVTRAADNAVIKGTNFSSWYNASESTIFFESGIAPTNNSKYFTFYGSDGGGTELIESAAVSGPGANIFTYADSTVYSNTSVTDASATKLKFAAGIKLNDVNLAVNGILGTTDDSATNPDAINQLIIGNYTSGSYYLNTSIKKLSYYNKRLPNAQLQGLTAQ